MPKNIKNGFLTSNKSHCITEGVSLFHFFILHFLCIKKKKHKKRQQENICTPHFPFYSCRKKDFNGKVAQ